ncbi:hypothetical protein, conserved [Eimeria acervulina]|uniref:Type 1 phosphatases regulator n=1 Tax=Eimeria acervulina TaxID=5801 RepID=U6GM82_EIMAC|nr:hypothetical protein, conserved [Eimeria acervulina]CDI80667.1 hypothetical protein, conserved [Eimeria acervulina]
MASTTRTETVTPAVIHIVSPSSAASPAAADDATTSATAAATAAESAAVETPKQVAWVEGTLDNEDLGRKSSKVCCIYHKPRAFGESSSSSSSSSSSDSEGEGAAAGKKKARKHQKCKHHRGSPHPPCGDGKEAS